MPRLPYTEAPLAAVPVPDPDVQRVQEVPPGEAPSQIHRPAGCHFHPRCPYAEARCRVEDPLLREVRPGQRRRAPDRSPAAHDGGGAAARLQGPHGGADFAAKPA